jgi:polycystin 1L2
MPDLSLGQDITTHWWLSDYGLTQDDRKCLQADGEWINDTHMYAVSQILSRQFPDIQGRHDTRKVPIFNDKTRTWTYNNMFPTADAPAVQIHHNGSNHWIASAKLCDTIYIMDSAYAKLTGSTQLQLAALYAEPNTDMTINVPTVQKQSPGNCGMFAIANAVQFCFSRFCGEKQSQYKTKQMRQHTIECLENGKFTPFPSNTLSCRRRNKVKKVVINIACRQCHLPDIFDNMVCCDTCDKWLHNGCTKNQRFVKQTNEFVCHMCMSYPIGALDI